MVTQKSVSMTKFTSANSVILFIPHCPSGNSSAVFVLHEDPRAYCKGLDNANMDVCSTLIRLQTFVPKVLLSAVTRLLKFY